MDDQQLQSSHDPTTTFGCLQSRGLDLRTLLSTSIVVNLAHDSSYTPLSPALSYRMSSQVVSSRSHQPVLAGTKKTYDSPPTPPPSSSLKFINSCLSSPWSDIQDIKIVRTRVRTGSLRRRSFASSDENHEMVLEMEIWNGQPGVKGSFHVVFSSFVHPIHFSNHIPVQPSLDRTRHHPHSPRPSPSSPSFDITTTSRRPAIPKSNVGIWDWDSC
ncbi:hypothetical protein SISSUDRAFT_1067847 [Sistotremastrum suecicum HHB10207 ss-3]|uniref:Uncharacterized protein n=1 Tax=Sistotremastrum suecicum HHB10207 ss-3 TaxID=1314776 RepID=A0A165WMF2_9AGAM|nr:hypothetical protein SISSUDRAFT_1067847 [Sistotremastrum suecicum HHB10207 ss-3]